MGFQSREPLSCSCKQLDYDIPSVVPRRTWWSSNRGRGDKSGGGREQSNNNKKPKIEHVIAVANSDSADKKKRQCYYCKEEGHFIATCPKLAEKSCNVSGSAIINVDEDGGYSLMSAVSLEDLVTSSNRLDECDVMLDSGASNILQTVTKGERISTQGVNGRFSTDTYGRLEGFFDLYGSTDAVANILSLPSH